MKTSKSEAYGEPEAPNVWDEVFANLKTADTLYKKKRKFYARVDFILRMSIILAALAFTASSYVFIRAYWVCGF
jgi:ABC-type multidrug transport system permease subunit